MAVCAQGNGGPLLQEGDGREALVPYRERHLGQTRVGLRTAHQYWNFELFAPCGNGGRHGISRKVGEGTDCRTRALSQQLPAKNAVRMGGHLVYERASPGTLHGDGQNGPALKETRRPSGPDVGEASNLAR